MNDRNDGETMPWVVETSSFSQVVFSDVPSSYKPNAALTCRYAVTGGLQPTPRDWIGIFKVGWQSTQGYHSYEWVQACLDHVGPEPLIQQVVFKENCLPKDDGEFYQFCYVDSNGHVRGASTPFRFQNPAESSLDCSLEKDLLVVTTQEQAEMLEKEKEEFLKEIESLKESRNLLKGELDERLQEIRRLRKCLDDMKSKDKLETFAPDGQDCSVAEQSLHENYEKALQKISALKQENAELQQKFELQSAEKLKLTSFLKETEHNYNKLQDRVKLLEVDMQSSKRDNEKLHTEIEELLRAKKTLEEQRENRVLQASVSEQENDTKVQIHALLTQLTEARGLLRREMQNCKDTTKRAESAEQELKEARQKLAEMSVSTTEAEDNGQIKVQLKQAQEKIREMEQTSNVDRQELQTEINRLRKAVFDYQVASVAAMSEQLPTPQSPPAPTSPQGQTPPTDDTAHPSESADDVTGDSSRTENKRQCQHCLERFPGISEDELAAHELSHKVCPFCTLICDDWEQRQFEDHVYSHEE